MEIEPNNTGNDEIIIVVKLGGTERMDYAAFCSDVASLQKRGLRQVLVHGGSAETNTLSEALQYPARFITSPSGFTSRHTDRRTLEIFTMAVNGKLNTSLVEQLQTLGVNALGLCGLDGRLIVAERKVAVQSIENGKRKVIRDDYTGKIKSVNTNLIHTLLADGYTPVIAPLAVSPVGEALNVDADRAAAMIAGALHVNTLILLTAAPGLMYSFPDESTIIYQLPQSRLAEALNYAEGRMKKKVLGAQEALQAGVERVIIADGRCSQPISSALAGGGTVIQ
jgi:acetylglutamate/LysW-gamma-L-alpha-aminoadipate kinase